MGSFGDFWLRFLGESLGKFLCEFFGGYLGEFFGESFAARVPCVSRILEPSASIEILGFRFFDLSGAVTYADAFLTIAVVCLVSFGCFLVARFNAPKKDK